MNINFRGQRLIPGYDFLQSQHDNKPIKVLVHEFIQSVVFTPFPQDSELQIERLILAGNIYDGIGFKRKAAFYRRFAALKSVTVQSDWQACYDSLLGSLEGFGLTLDPNVYESSLADKCSSVWPGLHVQLIEELITCCKKIQTSQAGTLAIRHMSFMMHTLDFYLSTGKKRDTARDLEEASTVYGEDSPIPLKLSSGHVIPTVNLTKYPLCLKIEPLPLPLPLRPVRLISLRRLSTLTPTRSAVELENPFIFTPIANHSSLSVIETNRRTGSNSNITDIVWVQDEPCTTTMVLANTLPFELNVSSIKLLTDGVPLETQTAGFKMDPDPNRPLSIQLIGIPRQLQKTSDDLNQNNQSRLEIFGYSTHLLGVKSNCRLDMLPRFKYSSHIVVEVCPPLPKIKFRFDDSKIKISTKQIPLDQVGKDLIVLEADINHETGNDLDSTELSIHNFGDVDLHYIFVRHRNTKAESKISTKLIKIDEEMLEQMCSSALKAGTEERVPMYFDRELMQSQKAGTSITTIMDFEYSGGLALKEKYCRKSSLKIMMNFC